MADKLRVTQWRYKVDMTYLDQVRNVNTDIRVESIKFIIIDHQYETNSMPIIYMSLALDRKLIDDMILNCNNNLMMLAIYKYDDLSDLKQEVEIFRDRFTYFLPNDVSMYDSIDYTEESQSETLGNTYSSINIGLMSVKHINNNKRTFNLSRRNVRIGDMVNLTMEHFNNLIMEPIADSTVISQLNLVPRNSVASCLKSLNNIRALYSTPYRYYQDFDATYLLSSSGKAVPKYSDHYTSVLINVKDIADRTANDVGVIINRTAKTYEIPINYMNVEIWDDTITNKSKTDIIGMSQSGESKVELKNKASYIKSKAVNMRINNDNERMLENVKADKDNTNFLVYLQKTDLDSQVLTLNKRITIHHINRYIDHNGDYLMTRKRECYLREDRSFVMSTMLNLKEIQK